MDKKFPDPKKNFSENLKKLMKKKNISRKQLSQELDIKYTTICEWIKGTMMPRSEALSSLAEYFGITVSELLADEETTSSFIKAPLLVVLNEESFEDNLTNHNYGYVLTDKENQFAIKMYTRVNINMTQANTGDTMIFEKITINDYSELIDKNLYFIRRNNNEGEIAMYMKGGNNDPGMFMPIMNKNDDFSIIDIAKEKNLEIYGRACALNKTL